MCYATNETHTLRPFQNNLSTVSEEIINQLIQVEGVDLQWIEHRHDRSYK